MVDMPKKWDDTPLWEQKNVRAETGYETKEVVKPNIPWADEVIKGRKSAAAPSPLLCWHLEESKKRGNNQRNEIDIAYIKAAAKGVINIWTKRYQANPQKFQPILEDKKCNWEDIIND